jgi:hypothetical protein
MSARFRVVHFVPDPILGARVPIGAFVRDGGAVFVARARFVPDALCVGGSASAAVLRELLRDLERLAAAPSPTDAFGPHVFVDAERPMPDGVREPVRWLEAYLLPSAGTIEPTRRTPPRASAGMNFFQVHHAARYVGVHFEPRRNAKGWIVGETEGLQTITHWVAGFDSALLLEPLVLGRTTIDKDIREIASRFIGYRWARERKRIVRETRLVAYVVGGAVGAARQEAIERLRDTADDVVDTSEPAARTSFLSDIAAVSQRAEPLLRVPSPSGAN